MPNWCNNELTVRGSNKELKEFVKEAKGNGKHGPLTYEGAVPMPEKLRHTSAPADQPNWYDWACSNWGVKWDASNGDIKESYGDKEHSDGEVHYNFDSPWGPPSVWLSKVAKKWYWLDFELTWEEPGMCASGTFRAIKGSLSHTEHSPKECERCGEDYIGPECYCCDL